MNGAHLSHYVDVSSGVQRGSILGSLRFLIYINDISDIIPSDIRLYAGDCALFREVCGGNDHHSLQNDLYRDKKSGTDGRCLNIAKHIVNILVWKLITAPPSFSRIRNIVPSNCFLIISA